MRTFVGILIYLSAMLVIGTFTGCSKKDDGQVSSGASATASQNNLPETTIDVPPPVDGSGGVNIMPIPGNVPGQQVFCTLTSQARGALGSGQIARTTQVNPANWNGQALYTETIPAMDMLGKDGKVILTLTNSNAGLRGSLSIELKIDDQTDQNATVQGSLNTPLVVTFRKLSKEVTVSCVSAQPQSSAPAFTQVSCNGQAQAANRRMIVQQIIPLNGQNPTMGKFQNLVTNKMEIFARLLPQVGNQAAQFQLLVKDSVLGFEREFSTAVDSQEMRFHSNEGRVLQLDLGCTIQ